MIARQPFISFSKRKVKVNWKVNVNLNTKVVHLPFMFLLPTHFCFWHILALFHILGEFTVRFEGLRNNPGPRTSN